MRKKLLAATLASLLAATAQAQTTFVCDGVPCSYFSAFGGPGGGPVPTGINNLVVNGEVYNVTFSNTMNSPFTTIAAGEAAADAIGNFVTSFLVSPLLVGPGIWLQVYGAQFYDGGYIETEFGTPNSVLIQVAWVSTLLPYNGAVLSGNLPGEIPNTCGPGTPSVCTSWTKVSTSNKLLNGTFVPTKPGCQLGATSIPNWTVANNVKNCNAAAIAPPNGTTYYVDLTGTEVFSGQNDAGTISQTVNTVVGKKYTLSFYFGGNPLWKVMNPNTSTNDGEYKAMQVLINNTVQGVYGVHTANAAYNNAQWQKETMSFTATTPFTSVAFQSLNGLVTPSEYGPLIGDVVLVED